MPAWATLLLVLASVASAAFAGLAYRNVHILTQRGTLRGVRRHQDDQDEVIRGMRREWAAASEDMTKILEDVSKERGKVQAASARAAKSEKRKDDDVVTDFEEYRKRVLGAHRLGEA